MVSYQPGRVTPVKFWKSIGGYTYCVQWKNRWYYVGSAGVEPLEEVRAAMDAWFAWHKARNIPFTRVGTFGALETAIRKHGNTPAAYARSFPRFTKELLK